MGESISTCRFAQRMAAVAVDARPAECGGLAAAHGSLLKLDPVLQQYLAVGVSVSCACACMRCSRQHDSHLMPFGKAAGWPQNVCYRDPCCSGCSTESGMLGRARLTFEWCGCCSN